MKLSALLCKLPQPVRSFFFRTLEHPWAYTAESLPFGNGEQYCRRCGAHQHYTSIMRSGSVKWISGRHPMVRS